MWVGKCGGHWDEFDVFLVRRDVPKDRRREGEGRGWGPDAVTRPTNTFVEGPTIPGDGTVLGMTHTRRWFVVTAPRVLRKKTGKPYSLRPRPSGRPGRAGKGDTAYFSVTNGPADEYAWYKGQPRRKKTTRRG